MVAVESRGNRRWDSRDVRGICYLFLWKGYMKSERKGNSKDQERKGGEDREPVLSR